MAASPWPVIHAEREALAADLAPLDGAQWTTQSLCDEWSVSPAEAAGTRRENEPKNAKSDSPSAESGEAKSVVNVRVFKGGAEARR